MKKLITLTISIIFPFLLIAQENLPVIQDVKYEVLTDSLHRNSKIQTLQIQITCDASSTGERFNLQFRGMSGLFVPVAVERDGEEIWLIQSENASDNEIVLAWQTLNGASLQLLPGDWTVPYRLDLVIQVSLDNLKDVENLSETRIDLTILRNNAQYLAIPTGRGNQIGLK